MEKIRSYELCERRDSNNKKHSINEVYVAFAEKIAADQKEKHLKKSECDRVNSVSQRL